MTSSQMEEEECSLDIEGSLPNAQKHLEPIPEDESGYLLANHLPETLSEAVIKDEETKSMSNERSGPTTNGLQASKNSSSSGKDIWWEGLKVSKLCHNSVRGIKIWEDQFVTIKLLSGLQRKLLWWPSPLCVLCPNCQLFAFAPNILKLDPPRQQRPKSSRWSNNTCGSANIHVFDLSSFFDFCSFQNIPITHSRFKSCFKELKFFLKIHLLQLAVQT